MLTEGKKTDATVQRDGRAGLCTKLSSLPTNFTCSFTNVVKKVRHKEKFMPLPRLPLLADPIHTLTAGTHESAYQIK